MTQTTTARESKMSVEQVAEIIRQMNLGQCRQLLRLVPELLETSPEPFPSDEMKAWAEAKLAEARRQGARPRQDSDPFIGGLTVREFFSLPEEEQARIWTKAEAEALKELDHREYPVRSTEQ